MYTRTYIRLLLLIVGSSFSLPFAIQGMSRFQGIVHGAGLGGVMTIGSGAYIYTNHDKLNNKDNTHAFTPENDNVEVTTLDIKVYEDPKLLQVLCITSPYKKKKQYHEGFKAGFEDGCNLGFERGVTEEIRYMKQQKPKEKLHEHYAAFSRTPTMKKLLARTKPAGTH